MTLEQPFLLDVPRNVPDLAISGSGQLRTRTGGVVEDVTCFLLRLTRLAIDGRKPLCWDAETRGGDPLEIKSLKPGGRSIIYKWRAEKEGVWEKENRPAYYVFVAHRTTGAKQLSEVYASVMAGADYYIVPSYRVRALLVSCTLRFVRALENPDPRDGCRRKGYVDGYFSLPHKAFAAECDLSAPVSRWGLYDRQASGRVFYPSSDARAMDAALEAFLS